MAVHLYGVVRDTTPLPPVEGRQGGALRLVTGHGLGVIVSDVGDFARAGAADLLAHARVLEAVAVESTVIPMRFGCMLPDDDDVRSEVLTRDHQHILGQLAALDGLVQVTVRVSMEEEAGLRAVLRLHPELAALRERVRETSPPTPSDDQVKLGEHVYVALQQIAAAHAIALSKPLERCAIRTYRVEPASAYEVLNAALLVERDRRHELDQVVGGLRREYFDQLVIRYVGPQPPYCFVDG